MMQIGYDPSFIDPNIRIPLPTFGRRLARSVLRKPGVLRGGLHSDHIHFTLVMNKHTRQLIYSAHNIDQSLFEPKVPGNGERSWKFDRDIGAGNQLGNEYYKDRKSPSGRKIPNPYDRGHMVMRFNNMWGATVEEADKAGKATFIYANSSLQHENLNRDEWKALEMTIVRDFQHDANDRLSVFTGPIFGSLDRHINLSDNDSARVPSGFFKVVCFRTKHREPSKQLGVLAFAIFQDPQVLRDKKGAATVKTDRRYQFTISELQDLTGINFGRQLYDRNPLFYRDLKARTARYHVPAVPERIPVNRSGDVVPEAETTRFGIEALSRRTVVINSAMINPKGSEKTGEWVSLYNRGATTKRLKRWKLVDGQGREAVLTGSIGAGEALRVRGKAMGKVKLSNSGGSLMLYDGSGRIVDHVTWSRGDVKRVPEGIAYMFERGQ